MCKFLYQFLKLESGGIVIYLGLIMSLMYIDGMVNAIFVTWLRNIPVFYFFNILFYNNSSLILLCYGNTFTRSFRGIYNIISKPNHGLRWVSNRINSKSPIDLRYHGYPTLVLIFLTDKFKK